MKCPAVSAVIDEVAHPVLTCDIEIMSVEAGHKDNHHDPERGEWGDHLTDPRFAP